MTDKKENEGYSYQEIVDMSQQKKEKKKKTDPKSKAANTNNNISKRKSKTGDKGHETRKKNSQVKVDRSKIRDIKKLQDFMEYKSIGLNDEICCNYIGINKQTLVNWKKRAVAAIEYCEDNDMHYDDHDDYDYIRFKSMLEETNKEIIKNGMKAYRSLAEDIPVYLRDEEGDLIIDERGNPIISKIARQGNVTAVDRLMKIADPENFDNSQKIDINEKKQSKVVMITHVGDVPRDRKGNVDEKQLENMKNSFLSELENQQEGLTNLIESRSQTTQNGDTDE